MPRVTAKNKSSAFRGLPSIDEVLRSERVQEITVRVGDVRASELSRIAVAALRSEVAAGKSRTKEGLLVDAIDRVENLALADHMSGTQRVINATGVIIHTNLGRAPLSVVARQAVNEAFGYCTLEYDLATGSRGRRGRRAEDLIVQLTGAEDALIVNNCAAAAFFVLTAFAAGSEVIISRGEMVEIGGDFRVPDVLSQSGGKLREVGTTNRTRLADFEKAINRKTRVILRVHPSNYRIVGFTAMPSLSELSALATKNKIILYEDIGSGALIDLSKYGLKDEPVVSRSIADGADLVTFSGDKLLGGPQAGIIAGRRAVIEKLRKHPLYRALRVDKLAYAALEATLDSYARSATETEIPVVGMLAMTKEKLEKRASMFVKELRSRLGRSAKIKVEVVAGVSAIGGGAAPAVQPDTALIALSHTVLPVQSLEQKLRLGTPPVVARIIDGQVVIDLRTVAASEEGDLTAAIIQALT
ncbi:MAG: L-seryl-tRNA(Sec) selenium transferase [Acidobacteria bacterium]|nr:L-seryl-tRNA(Sec) selenium transferase [Acidobacteriota bacterium]